MARIRDDLDGALSALVAHSPGNFAFQSTHTTAPNPVLRLDGLGRIGLPLSDDVAKAVVAHCEPSLRDKDVPGGACEMKASKVATDNPGWAGFIARVMNDVYEPPGVDKYSSRPKCELYQLVPVVHAHEPDSESGYPLPLDDLANVNALLDATTIGATSIPFDSLVRELGSLPWNEGFVQLCINAIHARRSENAFSNIRARIDSALRGVTQNYAHRVDYSTYDSDRLRASFSFCADAGGLCCLNIFLNRAFEPRNLEPSYVEKALLPMVDPFIQVARERQLPLTTQPFPYIIHTIICTWVNACLLPRPDESRIRRLYLNRYGARTSESDRDGCYLGRIAHSRQVHVGAELDRWAKHIATLKR
ncbi:hypothetical protein AURDEDRAFT_155455 [Auricularia subglabra TFB-10046 SS5]|nr:hypothetical protein AURDEDRAFT_155455 [Auricularia subglabra TFB-10046 SS5]